MYRILIHVLAALGGLFIAVVVGGIGLALIGGGRFLVGDIAVLLLGIFAGFQSWYWTLRLNLKKRGSSVSKASPTAWAEDSSSLDDAYVLRWSWRGRLLLLAGSTALMAVMFAFGPYWTAKVRSEDSRKGRQARQEIAADNADRIVMRGVMGGITGLAVAGLLSLGPTIARVRWARKDADG